MPNLPSDALVAAIVAIIVQIIKPYLERAIPPTSDLHDNTLQGIVVLLSLGGVVLEQGPQVGGAAWASLIGTGFGTALMSLGGYHVITRVAVPRVAQRTRIVVNPETNPIPDPTTPPKP